MIRGSLWELYVKLGLALGGVIPSYNKSFGKCKIFSIQVNGVLNQGGVPKGLDTWWGTWFGTWWGAWFDTWWGT